MRTISISPSALLALIGLLVPTGSALSQPATMTWPDAIAQLTHARSRAETCVAFMKKYGDKRQVARGQLTYANAKADDDAVIAGLIAALSAGEEPASLSSLQARLNTSVSGLAEFCNTVDKLVPNTAGQKGGVLAGALTVAIPPLLKMLSDSVTALIENSGKADALTRATIKTQLEAARWPAFSEVKAAE
jgi:hypothetical protein